MPESVRRLFFICSLLAKVLQKEAVTETKPKKKNKAKNKQTCC